MAKQQKLVIGYNEETATHFSTHVDIDADRKTILSSLAAMGLNVDMILEIENDEDGLPRVTEDYYLHDYVDADEIRYAYTSEEAYEHAMQQLANSDAEIAEFRIGKAEEVETA